MNTASMNLDTVLYKLLYHCSYRNAFLQGNYEQLKLTRQELKQLDTIDKDELVQTSKLILRDLLYGSPDSGGALRKAFSISFNQLERSGCDVNDLMYEFLESDEFLQYRIIPFAGIGVTLEEAFYNFVNRSQHLTRLGLSNHYLLVHEFMIAIFSILVANKYPNFIIQTEKIRNNGTVYYSVQNYPVEFGDLIGVKITKTEQPQITYLYAATAKGLVKGQISALNHKLIEIGTREKISLQLRILTSNFSVTYGVVEAVTERLYQMELIG